ncbi:MAG: glycerophosphodiester phosphodiesterase [Nocardioides sp.]|nr:glycerophosphodiester phosphodiesterase [Nocardioides sp.]
MTAPRPQTGYAFLDAPAPGDRLAFAHRGGARHPDLAGLENTEKAFAHAVALGYDYLETDVHVTRDGVLLAFHDGVLERVSDGTGSLADLSAAEVSAFRIGGEPIPTLGELFDAFPEARFNIDLKSDGAVEALADFVQQREAHDRVLVGSFSSRRLLRFRRLTRGRVPISAGPLEVALFRLLPSGRLARLLTGGRVAALQVPHRAGPISVVTAGLVRRAHWAGAHVHVWTIDDPAEMVELLDRGVDGLITDRTDVLKRTLVGRGQWRDDR